MNHWILLTLASETDNFYELEEVEDVKIQSKSLLKDEKSQREEPK